ncbi:hypothetical protein E8E11_003276 [Didymella keratinophila]|nr:hypothetical protein E8E11_003276 [Didymella keratinophila]
MNTERSRELSTNEVHEQIANVASLEATLTTNGATMNQDHLRPTPIPIITLHLAKCLHRTTPTTLTDPMIGLCMEIIHKPMLTMLLLNKLALKLEPKGKGKDFKDLECLKYLKYLKFRRLSKITLSGRE